MKKLVIAILLFLNGAPFAFAKGDALAAAKLAWVGASAQRREGKLGDKEKVFAQGFGFSLTPRLEFGWLGAIGGGGFANFEQVRKSSEADREYSNIWSHHVMTLGVQGVAELLCLYGRFGYVNQNHFFDAKTIYDNRTEWRNIAGDGYVAGYGLFFRMGSAMVKLEMFHEEVKLYPKYIHGGLIDNFDHSSFKGILLGFEGRIR